MSKEKHTNPLELRGRRRRSFEKATRKLREAGFGVRAAEVALVAILSLHQVSNAYAKGADGLHVSGSASVESEKTRAPSGKVVGDGPYLNIIGTAEYEDREDTLDIGGVVGMALKGKKAGVVDRVNLSVCGTHDNGDVSERMCTIHYFNPRGRVADEVMGKLSTAHFDVTAGDRSISGNAHDPYAEITLKNKWGFGAGEIYTISAEATAGSDLEPTEKPYGVITIDFRKGSFFGRVQVYEEAGQSHPDVTARIGVNF
jgi:hypothetical protein